MVWYACHPSDAAIRTILTNRDRAVAVLNRLSRSTEYDRFRRNFALVNEIRAVVIDVMPIRS